MALTELIAHAATAQETERRAILLAADDYSAVSRRVPLSNLYERGRSLGLGVQVSAQSWQGLGRDDAERYRITATADGGIWLMNTPYPQPLVELAGTRRVFGASEDVHDGDPPGTLGRALPNGKHRTPAAGSLSSGRPNSDTTTPARSA